MSGGDAVKSLIKHLLLKWIGLPTIVITVITAFIAAFIFVLVVGFVGSKNVYAAGSCGVVSGGAYVPAKDIVGYNQSIADEALAIANARPDVDDRILLATFETMIVETGVRNLANPTVPDSMPYYNDGRADGIGRDHDSIGVMQQRPSQGWGTVAQIMDPGYAIGKFMDRAVAAVKSGRGGGTAGNLAQTVQVSAFPTAYDSREANARDLIVKTAARVSSGSGTTTTTTSTTVAAAATATPPAAGTGTTTTTSAGLQVPASTCVDGTQTPGMPSTGGGGGSTGGASPVYNGTLELGIPADLPLPGSYSNPLSVKQMQDFMMAQATGPPSDNWNNQCERVVAIAYGRKASGYESALVGWNTLQANGLAHPGDHNPPVGALLYWDSSVGIYGHVAVYLGNGLVATSNPEHLHPIYGGKTSADIGIVNINSFKQYWNSDYRGWALPVFGLPQVF